MIIDLDKESASLPAWDVSVVIGGNVYKIKELTGESFDLFLDAVEKSSTRIPDEALSLFNDPKPPKSALTLGAMHVLFTNVLAMVSLRQAAAGELAKAKVKRAKCDDSGDFLSRDRR